MSSNEPPPVFGRAACCILAITALTSVVSIACQRPERQTRFAQLPAPAGSAAAAPGSLVIKDVLVGEGEVAVHGKRVVVRYEGRLATGPRVDSTHDRGKPGEFVVGRGSVIQGLDQGVVGMKPGGRRQLRIPANLAYGTRGVGTVVPPGSELVYDVELLEVRPVESARSL
jgi:FKBP-type peptidyl-prolyl cis-trans isomerase